MSKKIEEKVNRSFTNATPDISNTVYNDCKNTTVYRTAPAKRRGNMFWKFATFALALVLVITGLVGGIDTYTTTAQASTIELDVNPSVEIKLNRANRVVKVEAKNHDGEIIIGNMDFDGAQLEVTVNALIGSMLRNGYLNDLANSVLVSVDADKADVYAQLVDKVANEIKLTLKGANIEASVVSQWIKSSDAVNKIAKENEISVGKAQLISKIVQLDATNTVEQLVGLTVNELNLILQGLDLSADTDIKQDGAASENAYIGKDVALDKALLYLNNADITKETIKNLQIEFDCDNGLMVYEVEFDHAGYNYEFEIGAISGNVIAMEKEYDDYRFDENTTKLTTDELVDVVLKKTFGETIPEELLVEGAVQVYEYMFCDIVAVCFETQGKLYEYEVSVYGTILTESIVAEPTGADQLAITRADVESAIQAKLAQLGATVDALNPISRLKIRLEQNGESLVYNVSFIHDRTSYNGSVDAVTGAITLTASSVSDAIKDDLQNQFGNGHGWGHGGRDDDMDDEWEDFWNEWEDHWDDFDEDDWLDEDFYDQTFSQTYEIDGVTYEIVFDAYGNIISDKPIQGQDKPSKPSQTELDEATIKEIVARYAKLDLSLISNVVITPEQGRHGMHYEVEFVANGYEYEFELRADGSIIKWEKELAD